jgi:hypothetical protein
MRRVYRVDPLFRPMIYMQILQPKIIESCKKRALFAKTKPSVNTGFKYRIDPMEGAIIIP